MGHDQTPKQPEGAMVGVDTSIDAVPADRRRRRIHGGFILQSSASCGFGRNDGLQEVRGR
jgi:hypothetical protein